MGMLFLLCEMARRGGLASSFSSRVGRPARAAGRDDMRFPGERHCITELFAFVYGTKITGSEVFEAPWQAPQIRIGLQMSRRSAEGD